MSELICKKCQNKYEGSQLPQCPNCQAKAWSTAPSMIKYHHDPRVLPSAYPKFRSVLPADFPDQADNYYRHFAYSGTVLHSPILYGGEYCYIVNVPPYLNAGSAVPSGSAMPTRPMDLYVIAKAFGSDAHVYADDTERIQGMIETGTLQSLPICELPKCNNLCVPQSQFCAKHSTPALAD